MRESKFNAEVVSEMCKLYDEAEESLRSIGAKFGVNSQTVRRLLAREGIIIRPQGRPKKNGVAVSVPSSRTEDQVQTGKTESKIVTF